ncbi:MAG: HNH endonuclease signature motif containing protein [Caldilineaceae bacterium]
MFLRAHPVCVSCAAQGMTTEATEVDHIVRKADGGADAWENLQALCKSCHSKKTATEGRGVEIPGGLAL